MKTPISRTILSALASTVLVLSSQASVSAANTQIACSPDMAQYQCNTCFDGGFLYEWQEKTTLYDIAINNGSYRNVYFANENSANSIQIKNLGWSAVVFTTPVFDYDPEFFTLNRQKFASSVLNPAGWAPVTHPDGTVQWATIMDPGSSYKWTSTLPGKELFVTSVDKNKVTDANRSIIRDKNFVAVYSLKTHFRDTTTKTWQGSNTHVECQIIGAHFCGDGLVEPGKETCDDGGQNGQPGKCNTSCNGTVPPTPTPSCTGISASPTYGSSPVTTTLTCSGTGFTTTPTYKIDCGNGTNASMSGATGTCTYTNTSATDSKTYTPKCYINDTITAPACQTNIGVNPAPQPDLIIKKAVKNADAQTQSAQVNIGSGEVYSYTLDVKNIWSGTALGAKVQDNMPSDIEIIGTPTGTDWSCSVSGQLITCLYNKSIASGVSAPTITVQARIRPTAPVGVAIRNVAAVCARDPNMPTTDPANNCTPDPTPCKIGDKDYNPVTGKCDPATVVKDQKDLKIKKYAKSITGTGDSEATPVQITLGETFNYYYQFQNTNSIAISNVVIKDTFPEHLSYTGTITVKNSANQDVTSDWTITKWIYTGTTRITLIMKKKTPLEANSGMYTVEIPVTLAANAPTTNSMRNVAYICGDNTTPVTGPKGETICGNDNPPPIPDFICTPENNPHKDPACIIPVVQSGFDLSLKKYINAVAWANDYNTDSLSTATNAALSYQVVVTNKGPTSSTGVSTVQDILPAGVIFTGATTWNNGSWACTYTASGTTVKCQSSQVVASGSAYDTIVIPVVVTAVSGQSVTNIAAVDNPNEVNRCNTDGSMPANASTSCTKDASNSDPAVFNIPGSGGGTTYYYYTPSCINSIWSCSTTTSSSPTVPSGSHTGMDLCKASPWYGGSCGSGGTGGGSTPGSCGDGVLQAGEECDVKWATWCDASCKIKGLTNPGANPVTSFKLSIPGLANTLGSANFGTLRPFNEKEYGVVVGKGTPVFTLADVVQMNIDTQYQIPLMIPADRLFCLSSSDGLAISKQTLCNRIDRYTTATNISGTHYVVIGSGDYQERLADGTYVLRHSSASDTIPLFKGFDLATVKPDNTNLSLRDAFVGISGTAGNQSTITLYNRDPIADPTGTIDLAAFNVRYSGVLVGTTGTPVNRSLTQFVSTKTTGDVVNKFLGNVSTSTTTSTTTTSQATMGNIAVNGAKVVSSASVKSVAELETYALNGNKNILALKGNLVIENCYNSTFDMDGVRTVIVEGNITFKCNTRYANTTDSWAWIAKGGNIAIHNGTGPLSEWAVASLAGVYVAISNDGTTTSNGQITYSGNTTTQTILKIDGSLYGNANPLFNSRLYARGTSAYDILTTGTIITYSNRALVNPPPLLSQYLSNYDVQRVVK